MRWHFMKYLVQRGYLAGPATTVFGVTVFVPTPDAGDAAQADTALARVSEALSLIQRRDPRRFARILHDGVRLVFTRHIGPGQYFNPVNAIGLDLLAVMQWSTPIAAAAIVHEATHARLALSGVKSPKTALSRVERRCVEEEISFMRLLPEASGSVERWAAHRRATLATEWWTRHAKTRRRVALLEREGGPRWLLWLARLGRLLS